LKTLVLDGFKVDDNVRAPVMDAVTDELAGRGWKAEVLSSSGLDLEPCTGCFSCWTKRPGMCFQEDAIHHVCSKIMESDLLMIVCPVTFGGYSSGVKAIMDRTIGLVSPFFTIVRHEVHHKPRYDRAPALAALGISSGDCVQCPDIFRTLLYRNAVNFHSPALAVDVAGIGDVTDNSLSNMIIGMLDLIGSARFSELPNRRILKEDLAADPFREPLFGTIKESPGRALLLIGSPKARSTSSSLGQEFMARLGGRGWETNMLRILPHLKKEEKWQELIPELEKADLVALLSPLYVDSLPAPVTEALERIAALRKSAAGGRKQGFMAILNCGFPEAFHNYTGLAIARQFAQEAGYEWMGGLALGMGGAIDGKPLADCGRMARNVVKALDLAAASIDRGEAVPSQAVDLMVKPFLPRWLYIALGNWGWKRQAKRYGVKDHLYARPYQEGTGEK